MSKDQHGIDIENDTRLNVTEADEEDEEELSEAEQERREAEREAREERREQEMEEEDMVREEEAADATNPDAHRDEEPFNS